MTVITTSIHRSHSTAYWVALVSAAVVLTAVFAGLVVAFATSSGGSTPAPRTGVNSTTSGSGAASLCPGSVKDWSC
jgi:hypothetical protein